jgi:uncharacterized protein YcbX
MIKADPIHLKKIIIYPIKSLPGVSLPRTGITKSGSLKNDRRWALFDEHEKVLNAKRSKQLHSIHFAMPSPDHWSLSWNQNKAEVFEFQIDQPKIEHWFSEHLNTKLHLKENSQHGFPDDLEAKGPTLVSIQSLETICSWFPELHFDECLKRFRANLLISAPSPFWEDQLVGKKNDPKTFKLGAIQFQGLKVCQRCIVPSRDSQSGISSPEFVKIFKNNRENKLPPWAERSRFDHFYRLAINTQPISNQKITTLKTGDSLTLD